ncbi:TPA: hypothetical protein ACSPZB_004265, partial [Citrobacter freundii]
FWGINTIFPGWRRESKYPDGGGHLEPDNLDIVRDFLNKFVQVNCIKALKGKAHVSIAHGFPTCVDNFLRRRSNGAAW